MVITRKITLIFVFGVSIILNIIYLLDWINSPYDRYGILTQDVKVYFDKDTYITLPKGLVVRDESLQGIAAIDQFSNHRFSITVTGDFPIVDYNVDWRALHRFGSLYHADEREQWKKLKNKSLPQIAN